MLFLTNYTFLFFDFMLKKLIWITPQFFKGLSPEFNFFSLEKLPILDDFDFNIDKLPNFLLIGYLITIE